MPRRITSPSRSIPSALTALAAFAVGFSTLSLTPAYASNCARDWYKHNGSEVEIEFCDGGNVVITYEKPKASLGRLGIKPGAVLFRGMVRGSEVISGNTSLYSRRCGTAMYWVSGGWQRNGNRLVLRGKAPVRNANCALKRQRTDTLVFDIMAQ